MKPTMKQKAALAMVAAGMLGLSAPGGAVAAYNPVGSGSTKLVLAKPFAKLLAKNGVRIMVKEGAAKRGGAIVLPATGGKVDPGLGAGTVDNAGTVIFVHGRLRLPLRDVSFKAKRAPLYAKVGGSQLKLATASGLDDRRTGFGTTFTASGLRSTSKFVSRLAKKLRLRGVFRAGQMIGSVESVAQPSTLRLREKGRVQLAIDPAFKQKLDNLFVSVNPIAPAELAPGPVLSFPIGLESTLSPDASSGTLKLGGSAELLQLGSAQIFWREFWLQPEAGALLAESEVLPAPPHPGKQPQAPLLQLGSGGSVVSNPADRTIELSGQGVTLPAATAASLNDAFAGGSDVFVAGETVGIVSYRAVAD
jgi:hypothetical protein